MEITYQVRVDGEPVRFGHNYSTESRVLAWKSYECWASCGSYYEVAIDEIHDGEHFKTLRNSEAERLEAESEEEAQRWADAQEYPADGGRFF